MDYRIGKEGIFVKDFLKNEKHYSFADILKIEEEQTWPFKYPRIVFKNGRKKTIIPLNRQREFIQFIQKMLEK